MSEISLAVTKRALGHATGPHESERQIAYREASADIAATLAAVTNRQGILLRLGGRLRLVVADRGAIWRAHNAQYQDDFDALFTFLARDPSQYMRFLCEVLGDVKLR